MTNWLGKICQDNISPDDTVLDLGCGIQQGNDDIECKSILGVDIWKPYLDHIKNNINTVQISMSETNRFMDNSYDVVLCLDVVEHLDQELALKVIDECKRICRKKAIIYTPIEYKDNMESTHNAWGLGNNPHQAHKCVLHRNDFRFNGYIIHITDGDSILAIFKK